MPKEPFEDITERLYSSSLKKMDELDQFKTTVISMNGPSKMPILYHALTISSINWLERNYSLKWIYAGDTTMLGFTKEMNGKPPSYASMSYMNHWLCSSD